MNVLRLLITTILVAPVISACYPNSRVCSEHHHAATVIWTQGSGPGEEITFTSTTGEKQIFTLQSASMRGPAVKHGGDHHHDDSTCQEATVVVYLRSDSQVAIGMLFDHLDQSDIHSVSAQPIQLTVQVQGAGGSDLFIGSNPRFWLDDLAHANPLLSAELVPSSVRQDYIPHALVNDQTYVDLLQHTILNPGQEYGSPSLPDEQWVRVLLARDAGLVQYELLNGEIYTRSHE
ncbi:MAG: hypothetical protein KTR32_42405 [Granulosicoccus sp.]|nr:hypothetical protein [Granulosicoccus sp.]